MKKGSSLLFLILIAPVWAEWVSVGPDGGKIQILAINQRSSNHLLAIPDESPDTPRVFVSYDSGAHWQTLSRFCHRYPLTLKIDPHHSNWVYGIGSFTPGLLVSSDSGVSWSTVQLPGTPTQVQPDPHQPGRIGVAGYINSGGSYIPALFISTDHGATWTTHLPDTLAHTRTAQSLAFDPRERDLIWLGCSDSLVYRSTDGGETWQRRSSGLPANASIQSLTVNPANSAILLATTGLGIYRTTDAGITWHNTGVISPVTVEFPLTDGARGYAMGYDTAVLSLRLFVSLDSGATWRAAQPGFIFDWSGGFLSDPIVPNRLYAYTTTGIFRSDDGGNNWIAHHTGIRLAHISTIAVSPDDSSRVYLEYYENGIFKSIDGGNTWHRCAPFLACGNICGIGIAPGADDDVLYALEGKG